MHISEGVLSAPVLIGGAVLTLAGLVKGSQVIKLDDLPKAAILAAVFFTASLIHITIGPSAVHLVLNGLIGLIMGWAAFPVIFMALLLQGVLFQYGGLTTVGINTFNQAAPAILLGLLLRPGLTSQNLIWPKICGLICGGGSVLLSTLLTALALGLSGDQFTVTAKVMVLANIPIMVVEALVTMFCLQFLRKVRPGLLQSPALQNIVPEKL